MQAFFCLGNIKGAENMQSGVQMMRNHEIFPEIPLTTIPVDCHT
jgi:hypothetical protein